MQQRATPNTQGSPVIFLINTQTNENKIKNEHTSTILIYIVVYVSSGNLHFALWTSLQQL